MLYRGILLGVRVSLRLTVSLAVLRSRHCGEEPGRAFVRIVPAMTVTCCDDFVHLHRCNHA